ncbi:hypothetical protein KAM345_018770 [Aeromonas caviae]|nr:hypothetical protein KAM345_018770 [Aeromonas caviae]
MGTPDAAGPGRFAGKASQSLGRLRRPGHQGGNGRLQLRSNGRSHCDPGSLAHPKVRVIGEGTNEGQAVAERQPLARPTMKQAQPRTVSEG